MRVTRRPAGRLGGIVMRRIVAMLAVATSLASCVVVRDFPGERHGNAPAPRVTGFSVSERRIVRAYLAETPRPGWCPPGLAKKRNGCQPPGLAKKRYVTGRPLSSGVAILPLPRELQIRIGRPPRGYLYGMVDGDVLKLAVGSLLVVDAIAGLAG
jgi:hypothetical protein